MPEPVGDLDDPRLDAYRNIPDPDLRAARGLFVAEGRLVVSRLLASTRFAAQSVLVTPVARAALADALTPRPDVPVYEVSQDTMNHVAGFDVHRGCLAIGIRPSAPAPASVIASARCLAALERLGNADNVGGIFRSAAALGVDGVILDQHCTDPLYRKALRTSMGATLQVPFARSTAWLDTLTDCKRNGMRLLGLTPSPDAPPIRDVAASLASTRVVILVGHEGDGLATETMAMCDATARIPMRAGTDSLNVATAAAIAFHELCAKP